MRNEKKDDKMQNETFYAIATGLDTMCFVWK